jgi:hypothetical protein
MSSRSTRITLSILALALILTSGWGCNKSKGNISHKFPSHFKVFFTGETLGSIFPCGCHVPLGGISRRGGVLDADKADYPARLIVDAGSFAMGSGNYGRFVADYILKGYAIIGYNAVNIGVNETQCSIDQIKEWDQSSGNTLISANVEDGSGNPVTRRSVIVKIDQINVGITGITKAGRQPEGSVGLPTVVDPVPELQKVLAEFKKRNVDYVVLLADLSRADLEGILVQAPGVNLVIQGKEDTMQPAENNPKTGEIRFVKAKSLGKYLGWIRLDFKENGEVTSEESGMTELDNSVPTLSTVTVLLMQFKDQLKAKRDEMLADPENPFQQAGTVDTVDLLSGFAGTRHCMTCHVGYGLDQEQVGHFNAWNNLGDKDKTNPACLPCHTTGYGIPTGVSDPYRDSHLVGVTCEACHGPGAVHARDETAKEKGVDTSTMLPPDNPTGLELSKEVPAEVCLKCHTKEWSPDFDYATWVKRVNHSGVRNKQAITNPDTGQSIEVSTPQSEKSIKKANK